MRVWQWLQADDFANNGLFYIGRKSNTITGTDDYQLIVNCYREYQSLHFVS